MRSAARFFSHAGFFGLGATVGALQGLSWGSYLIAAVVCYATGFAFWKRAQPA